MKKSTMLQEPESTIVPLGRPMRFEPVRPNGMGVVAVHGFSGSPYQMRDLGQWLASEGYAVDIPRLPGHASSLRFFRQATLADWRSTVRQSVHALSQQCTGVFLIGRSFGGVLALLEALERPEKIRSVVGIGVPAPVLSQRVFRLLVPFVRWVRPTIKKPWAQPEEREERLAQGRYLALPLVTVAHYLNGLCMLTPERLRSLTVPILLLQGEEEEAVASASLLYYRRRLPLHHARTVLLSGAGHDAATLHGHAALRQEILSFLQTQAGGTSGIGQND